MIIKLINTIRYSLIYSIKICSKLFCLLSFSNLMLSILPLRTGEFSYIQGFRKYFKMPYSKTSVGLMGLRFIDYLVVYTLFLVSSFFIGIKNQNNLIGKISILFTISLLIFFILCWAVIKIRTKFKNNKMKRIINFLEKGIGSFRDLSKKTLLIIIIFSFIYWLSRIFLTYIVFILLEIDLSFIKIVFISLTLLLVGLFPIQTIGNFGIFEAGWTYFLVLFGFTYDKILPKILFYHLLILIPSIILGIIGYIYLKIKK